MRGRGPKFRDGYLYFLKPVGAQGPVKIGFSQSPAARLSAVMAWSPIPIEMIGSFSAKALHEDLTHRLFAESHSHSEWFEWSDSLQAFIEALERGAPVQSLLADPAIETIENPARGVSEITRTRRSLSCRLAWREKQLGKTFQHPLRRRVGFDVPVGEPLPPDLVCAINKFLALPDNKQARA